MSQWAVRLLDFWVVVCYRGSVSFSVKPPPNRHAWSSWSEELCKCAAKRYLAKWNIDRSVTRGPQWFNCWGQLYNNVCVWIFAPEWNLHYCGKMRLGVEEWTDCSSGVAPANLNGRGQQWNSDLIFSSVGTLLMDRSISLEKILFNYIINKWMSRVTIAKNVIFSFCSLNHLWSLFVTFLWLRKHGFLFRSLLSLKHLLICP